MNLFEEDFHIFAVRFLELRPTRLPIHYHCPSSCLCLLDESPLKVSNVGFGQVLVLASEEDDVIPKISVKVAAQPIPDALSLSNVKRGLPGFWINATQEVDA